MAKKKRMVWLGSRLPLPTTVQESPEGVDMALWVDAGSGHILAARVAPQGSPGLLRETLLEAMHHPAAPWKPGQPQAVAVEQEEGFGELEDILTPLGVEHVTSADFSLLHELVEAFADAPVGDVPTPMATGVDRAAQALFCERMAALWEAAPWTRASEGQMLSVEGLTSETLFISVLGHHAGSHGVAVFLTEDAAATLQQVEGTVMTDLPCLMASFESEGIVGADWVEEVHTHEWRHGPTDLFPAVMRLGSARAIPTEDEMHLLSTLVAVLADYSFDEGHPGYLEFTIDDRHGLACWPALPERRRKNARRSAHPRSQAQE